MINVSATSLRDFLDCTMKYYYRNVANLSGSISEDAYAGIIVHDTIEKFWDKDFSFYKEYLSSNLDQNMSQKVLDKVLICLSNFDTYFKSMCTDKDNNEVKFKIKIDNEYYLTGRIDKVTNTGSVIDWKTSVNMPKFLENDVQLIIYNEAYKRLYGKNPEIVLIANLFNNRTIMYKENKLFRDELFNGVIPNLLKIRKSKSFHRDGIFKKKCFECPFKNQCYKDGGINE